MSEFDIQRARELGVKLDQLSYTVCKTPPEIRFSIPVRPDDTDQVLFTASEALLSACDEIERLRAELAAEKTMRVMERENMKLHDEVFKP